MAGKELEVLVIDDAATKETLEKEYKCWEYLKEDEGIIRGKIEVTTFTFIPDADTAIQYIKQNSNELKKYDKIICDLGMYIKDQHYVEYLGRKLNEVSKDSKAVKRIYQVEEELGKVMIEKFVKMGFDKKKLEKYNFWLQQFLVSGPEERDLMNSLSPWTKCDHIRSNNAKRLGGLLAAHLIKEKLGKDEDKLIIYTTGLGGHDPGIMYSALILGIVTPEDFIDAYRNFDERREGEIIYCEKSTGYLFWPVGLSLSKSKRLMLWSPPVIVPSEIGKMEALLRNTEILER